ncbi:hypothetical protein HK102_003764, partial [Quaeritorhiza haematococci]
MADPFDLFGLSDLTGSQQQQQGQQQGQQQQSVPPLIPPPSFPHASSQQPFPVGLTSSPPPPFRQPQTFPQRLSPDPFPFFNTPLTPPPQHLQQQLQHQRSASSPSTLLADNLQQQQQTPPLQRRQTQPPPTGWVPKTGSVRAPDLFGSNVGGGGSQELAGLFQQNSSTGVVGGASNVGIGVNNLVGGSGVGAGGSVNTDTASLFGSSVAATSFPAFDANLSTAQPTRSLLDSSPQLPFGDPPAPVVPTVSTPQPLTQQQKSEFVGEPIPFFNSPSTTNTNPAPAATSTHQRAASGDPFDFFETLGSSTVPSMSASPSLSVPTQQQGPVGMVRQESLSQPVSVVPVSSANTTIPHHHHQSLSPLVSAPTSSSNLGGTNDPLGSMSDLLRAVPSAASTSSSGVDFFEGLAAQQQVQTQPQQQQPIQSSPFPVPPAAAAPATVPLFNATFGAGGTAAGTPAGGFGNSYVNDKPLPQVPPPISITSTVSNILATYPTSTPSPTKPYATSTPTPATPTPTDVDPKYLSLPTRHWIDSTIFYEIPVTDPVQDSIGKNFGLPERPKRRLMTPEDAKKTNRADPFSPLLIARSWRSTALLAQHRLLKCHPGQVDEIMRLWFIRLVALTKLKLFEIAAAEMDALGLNPDAPLDPDWSMYAPSGGDANDEQPKSSAESSSSSSSSSSSLSIDQPQVTNQGTVTTTGGSKKDILDTTFDDVRIDDDDEEEDGPLRFEAYPDLFPPGRRGHMVSFELRMLHAYWP